MSSNAVSTEISLDIREHAICFVVPAGAVVDANELDLPGGALVHGRLVGRVLCRTGSLIVSKGGEFSGHADADRIYIEGRVFPLASGEIASLKGKRFIAVSENAEGSAHLFSQAFAIHTSRFSATFTTLDRG